MLSEELAGKVTSGDNSHGIIVTWQEFACTLSSSSSRGVLLFITVPNLPGVKSIAESKQAVPQRRPHRSRGGNLSLCLPLARTHGHSGREYRWATQDGTERAQHPRAS